MEKLDFSLSKPGTAVFTKVSGIWWPGEITVDYPEENIPEKKREQKICVVKFCQENDFQVIFKPSEIKMYDTEDREDLLRKGFNKLKSGKGDILQNFKDDVKNAEQLIGGDPDILEKVNSNQTPKRPIYAGLFKSAPAVPSTHTPKHGQIKFNFLKKTPQGQSPKKARASTGGIVDNSDKQFKCDKCGYGTDRLGVLTAHLKSHTAPRAEVPIKAAPLPPLMADRPQIYTPTSSLATPTKTKTVPIAEVMLSPKKVATPKKSPVKPKEIVKSAQKVSHTLPPKKRKITREVAKKEILADWVDEDGNDIAREESSGYQEKSDEEDSVSERKVRKSDKEMLDAFDALLHATKPPDVPEISGSSKESSVSAPQSEAEAKLEVAPVQPPPVVLEPKLDKGKELKSQEQEVKDSAKVEPEPAPPVPVETPTRGRRGVATRRSGAPKESLPPTPTVVPVKSTRSSARNQDRGKSETKSATRVSPKKEIEPEPEPELKGSDSDKELLNATEALLNETEMSKAPEVPSRLSKSSTKASRKEVKEPVLFAPDPIITSVKTVPRLVVPEEKQKREASPKRSPTRELSLRSASPVAPPSPKSPAKPRGTSPEKATPTAKSPGREKSPKSPPLPKLIPTPSFQAQPVTVGSVTTETNQSAGKRASTNNTNNKSNEILQNQKGSLNRTSEAVSSTKPETTGAPTIPRASSPVKAVVSSPPKLVPVGTKPALQSAASQQVAVSTPLSASATASKPSAVKVQVTSSPPKLLPSPGVSFVTPNEKVVVSQIIPATSAPEKTVNSSGSSSTKVLVSSIASTTATTKSLTSSAPISAPPRILLNPSTATNAPRATIINNSHNTARSPPASTLTRTPQTKPPVRVQVPAQAKGSSVPPILRSPKTTTPARSTIGQAVTGPTGGIEQQFIVATKSAPEKGPPTITFAQKSTVPQINLSTEAQKSTPTPPALVTSQTTVSKQVAATAMATKSTVTASPKPPNILAQKSSLPAGSVVAQKSTVANVIVSQNTTQKTALAASTTQKNLTPLSKPPHINLPPLGPPPPIPGIATSVSQEMLAAAAAQTSTAKKRPAKPKPPKSPPKKGKMDVVGVPSSAVSSAIVSGNVAITTESQVALIHQPFSSASPSPTSGSGSGSGGPTPPKSPKIVGQLLTPTWPNAPSPSWQAMGTPSSSNDSGYTTYVRAPDYQPGTPMLYPTVKQAVTLIHRYNAGHHGDQLQLVQEGGDNGSLPEHEVGQTIHMLPIDQPDGTTRYVFVRVEQGANDNGEAHQIVGLDKTEGRIPGRVSQPQDQEDRAQGLFTDTSLNLAEAIGVVQEHERQQNPDQQQQVTEQGEASTSDDAAQQMAVANIGNVQHLINGAPLQFIGDGTGAQQFAFDPQQLEALAAAGGEGEQVYYLIDYNDGDPSIGNMEQYFHVVNQDEQQPQLELEGPPAQE